MESLEILLNLIQVEIFAFRYRRVHINDSVFTHNVAKPFRHTQLVLNKIGREGERSILNDRARHNLSNARRHEKRFGEGIGELLLSQPSRQSQYFLNQVLAYTFALSRDYRVQIA